MSVIVLFAGQTVFAMGSQSSNVPAVSARPAAAPKPKIKKTYIYIKNPEFKGRDTPLRADILKIAIDEVMKSEKYELIFTRNETWRDAKIDFVELIMVGQAQVWGKKLQGYSLQFYLVNGKTGKIMVTANESRIEDRRLIFTARSMIYQLFYGKELKDPKEVSEQLPAPPEEVIKEEGVKAEKKEKKEVNPREKVPKEAASPPEEEGKKIRPQKAAANVIPPKVDYNFKPPGIPPKKPIDGDDDDGNKDKGGNDSEGAAGANSAVAEDAAAAAKNAEELKPEPIPPKENESKTPEELSEDINEEIEKIVKLAKKAKAEKEAEKADDKKDDKAKDTPAGVAESEALTPQADKQYKPGDGNSEKAKKVYLIRAFGMVQTTQSTDLVETTNNIKHVGVGVISKLGMSPKSNDSLNLELALTVVVDSSKEFDIPGIKKLSIIYEKTFGDFFFHPHFGLEYETQSFINLAEVGAGLQVWENKLLWYKFGGGFYFKPYNYPLYMVGELGKTFVGTTNYGTDNKARTLDGTKKHFYLGMGTPWGFMLEFHMQVAEMTSQGFTNLSNTETTGYVSMLYQF